jgi:hypothetical protein
MTRGVVALLSVGLLIAWSVGLVYQAPHWLLWSDFGLAAIALGGLVAAGSPTLEGVATWPFVSFGLLGAWLFALATAAPAWLTWLNFAFGGAFLIVTVVSMLPKVDPSHFSRHGHQH